MCYADSRTKPPWTKPPGQNRPVNNPWTKPPGGQNPRVDKTPEWTKPP